MSQFTIDGPKPKHCTVTLWMFSCKNNCSKLIMNSITLRLIVGNFLTIATTASGSFEDVKHSLYIASGINGSSSSRSHNFSSEAGTWQSSMPSRL
jgi:hypothetical protein